MQIFNFVLTRARNVLPEERLAEARQLILNKCNFIVDVGANSGQWISGVRKRGYKGPALCIEPVKNSFVLLKSKKLFNTDILNCAVGNFNGFTTINVSSDSSLSSSVLDLNSCYKKTVPEIEFSYKEKIKILKLSEILKRYKYKRIFVKIDVQGYEYEVLKSIKKNDFQNIYGIEIETNLVSLYKNTVLIEDVVKFLRVKGFKPLRIENGFGMPNFGQQLQVDILFVKNSYQG